MRRISSSWTFARKRVLPMMWYVLVAAFIVHTLWTRSFVQSPSLLITPVIVGLVGYWMNRKFTRNLADEVIDGGDTLIVRFGSEQERIPMSTIMNVSWSYNARPARVTLRLVKPGKFGDHISFVPVGNFRLDPLTDNAIADDLMLRIDQARRASPA